ncbi:MobC family replication-relaxation protein [Pantoea ananatis]|uniref:MobC family replication-relaxation protein n=1 Tax=Pantoea ananas TaxID=553 RepID=UPI001B3031D0|nr:MobC family replication-relaxation protein [Pantoea ananatis]
MSKTVGLINDYHQRKERSKEYMLKLLSFLKEETYSDLAILMRVIGMKDRAQFYRFINKMVALGFVRKHVFTSMIGEIALWGITREGLSVVILEEDENVPAWFEPGKLKGWGLEHHLYNQKTRVILEEKGANGWINGDRTTFINSYPKIKHRPDGVITLPNGITVAIETERHPKSPARYNQIMASHLIGRTNKYWMFVFYVVPDAQKKVLLKKYFDGIKTVNAGSSKVEVLSHYRDVFRFFTMDELEATDFSQYQL